jgi:hypothetical protein
MVFLESLRPGAGQSLVICSFGMLGADSVATLSEPGARLSDLAGVRPVVLTDEVVWPNEARPAPAGILGFDALVVAGGFLVPGKNPGALSLVPLPRQPGAGRMHPIRITADKPGWFYHRAEWVDLDGDGQLELLTARATKPIGREGRGDLLWLEPPARDAGLQAASGPWTEHVLLEGPDVYFRTADLDGDGRVEVLTAQYFSRRLCLHWFEDAPSGGKTQRQPRALSSGKELRMATRLIDGRIGAAFDLELADLNGDGKSELLATNHESDEQASVFAYELPVDPRRDAWPRHTLLTGIKTRQRGINSASPGAATAFRPIAGADSRKPWVLVSGDGSQRAHLLRPASEAPDDWTYLESILADTDSTVGTCAVGDTNGDGAAEVFVPAYNKNRVLVYTFGRQTAP